MTPEEARNRRMALDAALIEVRSEQDRLETEKLKLWSECPHPNIKTGFSPWDGRGFRLCMDCEAFLPIECSHKNLEPHCNNLRCLDCGMTLPD